MAAITRIIANDLKLPSKVNKALAPFDAIVSKASAGNPSDRYATAREMARALEEVCTPASTTVVGDWVQKLVGDKVDERARLVAEIERSTTRSRAAVGAAQIMEPPPSGVHGVRQSFTGPINLGSIIPTAPMPTYAPPPESRLQPVQKSNTALVVVALVAFLMLAGRRRGRHRAQPAKAGRAATGGGLGSSDRHAGSAACRGGAASAHGRRRARAGRKSPSSPSLRRSWRRRWRSPSRSATRLTISTRRATSTSARSACDEARAGARVCGSRFPSGCPRRSRSQSVPHRGRRGPEAPRRRQARRGEEPVPDVCLKGVRLGCFEAVRGVVRSGCERSAKRALSRGRRERQRGRRREGDRRRREGVRRHQRAGADARSHRARRSRRERRWRQRRRAVRAPRPREESARRAPLPAGRRPGRAAATANRADRATAGASEIPRSDACIRGRRPSLWPAPRRR